MHNNIPKILILIYLFSIVSCDLLTTRDAEKPETGRSSNVIATTPEQLFENIKNSFSEKIEKDYINNFVDSSFLSVPYTFTPSSEAIFKYNVLTEWSLEAELTYFRNLVNVIDKNKNIIVVLEFVQSSIEGNGENHSFDYLISLPVIDESTSSLYKGNAFFRIKQDANNQWVITDWIDTSTGEEPTWSELKGRFYLF